MRSIQGRLMLIVGLGATLFWLAAAALTADRVTAEMRTLFDDDLRATAGRLLYLANHGLKGLPRREKSHDDDDDHDGEGYRTAVLYRMTDATGAVLFMSAATPETIFPDPPHPGFSDTPSHRIYVQTSASGLTVATAAPLAARSALAGALMTRLMLPLVVLLPLSLLGIAFALRRGLRPLNALRAEMAARGAQDLSDLPDTRLPTELAPIGAGLNALLGRLRAAFEAERSFAAHAAHELRTPVAGAIAQVQRLRAEIPEAAPRAAEIEAGLKRLMRTSEKLMQLARAEGGRMRAETPTDIRAVVHILCAESAGQVALSLPERPVLSSIEPDALGILLRNLLENAHRHGTGEVAVTLTHGRLLTVSNAGPVLDPSTLARLGTRFEKGAESQGTGLGLAIVKTIAERAGAGIAFLSPAPDRADGLAVRVELP